MRAGVEKRTLLMHEDMIHSEVVYLSFSYTPSNQATETDENS